VSSGGAQAWPGREDWPNAIATRGIRRGPEGRHRHLCVRPRPWLGERYEGRFLDDRRHGSGVYRWASGDVYSGPWERDIATGAPTPMMRARIKFEEEARAAVGKEGQKVCREVPVGIALRDWVRGVVVAVAPDNVAVRIDDPGQVAHLLAMPKRARRRGLGLSSGVDAVLVGRRIKARSSRWC